MKRRPGCNGSEDSATGRFARSARPGGFYEIRVRGHLDSKWAEWLERLEVELLENGEMILTGSIVDQAALMGILDRLHRLNLTLLSVNETGKRSRIERVQGGIS